MTVASSRPTPARYTYVVQSRGIKRDSFVGAFTTTLLFRPADTDWFFAGFCLLVFGDASFPGGDVGPAFGEGTGLVGLPRAPGAKHSR